MDGWDIEGYVVTPGKPDPLAKIPLPGPTVERVKVDPNRIYDVPDVARDEDSWQAFTSEGEVGMRTVCNGCRSSLNYCHCPHPRVWVDHLTEAVVVFKPRKNPLPAKRW
jgi:hypothetical protein